MNRTKKIVMVSMLIALSVILSRILGIEISNTQRIGFSFIPAAICGALFGPWMAGFAGAIGDVVGYLLKPTGGYLPGFTVTAFLVWMIYGLFFYKKDITWPRVIGASFAAGACNLLTGTYWLTSFMETPYLQLLSVRLPFQLLLVAVRIAVLGLILDRVTKELKRSMGSVNE